MSAPGSWPPSAGGALTRCVNWADVWLSLCRPLWSRAGTVRMCEAAMSTK